MRYDEASSVEGDWISKGRDSRVNHGRMASSRDGMEVLVNGSKVSFSLLVFSQGSSKLIHLPRFRQIS